LNKIWKRLILLIAVITSLGFNLNPAWATSLSVPIQGQYPYGNLCWATSSSMIISYFNGENTNRTVTIAQDKYGLDDFNKTAQIEDSRNAVNTYAGRYGTISNSALSWLNVKRQIDWGYPIYARWNYYSSAHAVVVKGYNEGNYRIIYNNPTSTGAEYSENYDWFVSNEDFVWDKSLYYF